MTWLTTWPQDGTPQYAAHDTEADAARHADDIVASKRAAHATYYAWDDEDARPHETHGNGARSAAQGEVVPANHNGVIRPKWNDPIEGEA